jgi:MFS transporter, ACS family, glucarate transporter
MVIEQTTRVRWFLVFWLFVLSAVSYLDRVNISIAAGPISDAYHLSDVQLGKVFSAMLVGYALFQTIGGRLADRYGPRRVLTAGVIWWGIFTALTALVPANIRGALFFFISVRFLLGAGEAVIYPSANQFIARWIPVNERGLANGWIFAGVGAGAGLTPPLITYFMLHYGWRSSFWACSLIGFLAGGIWFLIARDTPDVHPRVSTSELAEIRTGLMLTTNDRGSRPNLRMVSWQRVLRSKEVWAVTISYFCYGYVAWIFFSWFYRYLAKVRGLDLKASSFYSMLPFIAMLVCCLLGGTINDWLTRLRGPRVGRCILATVAIAMAGGFIAYGARAQSTQLASFVLAGGAGALYLSQSSFWSVTADIAGTSSGVVSGFMNMGSQIGSAITASLTPWIAARFGWNTSFLVAAALCIVGAACWLIVDPTRKLSSPLPENHGSVATAAPAPAAMLNLDQDKRLR